MKKLWVIFLAVSFIGCTNVKELIYYAEKCNTPKSNKPIFDYSYGETITLTEYYRRLDEAQGE